MTAGTLSGWSTAMSFSSSALVIVASARVPSANRTVIVSASATTWSAVRISAASVTTTPVPWPSSVRTSGSPPSDSMRTSDGRISA